MTILLYHVLTVMQEDQEPLGIPVIEAHHRGDDSQKP
jgi:hypothetical protein